MSLPAAVPARLSEIDWRWALPRILFAFLVTRLLMLAVLVAVEVTQPPPPEGIQADDRPILGSLTAWDGGYYLDIVENGYRAEADPFPNYAFFPAYPVLVKGATLLTGGDSSVAAVGVSNLALFLALVAFYALSLRHLDRERSIWALWFLLLAPGAIGFSMSYTEGLFLVFACGAFFAAETRRPWAVGILLALAALTRVPGILLLLPVVVLYIGRDGWRPTRDWIPLVLPIVALGLFFLYLWDLTGDPLATFSAQDYWRSSGPNAEDLGAGQVEASSEATMVISTAPPWVIGLWVATLAFYAFLFVYFRHDRLPAAYWIVALLGIVGVFASGKLLSAPRYIVASFPFYWVLANRTSVRGRSAVLVAFAAVQVLLLWLAFTWSVPP